MLEHRTSSKIGEGKYWLVSLLRGLNAIIWFQMKQKGQDEEGLYVEFSRRYGRSKISIGGIGVVFFCN